MREKLFAIGFIFILVGNSLTPCRVASLCPFHTVSPPHGIARIKLSGLKYVVLSCARRKLPEEWLQGCDGRLDKVSRKQKSTNRSLEELTKTLRVNLFLGATKRQLDALHLRSRTPRTNVLLRVNLVTCPGENGVTQSWKMNGNVNQSTRSIANRSGYSGGS